MNLKYNWKFNEFFDKDIFATYTSLHKCVNKDCPYRNGLAFQLFYWDDTHHSYFNRLLFVCYNCLFLVPKIGYFSNNFLRYIQNAISGPVPPPPPIRPSSK